jgi:hypothetical protein
LSGQFAIEGPPVVDTPMTDATVIADTFVGDAGTPVGEARTPVGNAGTPVGVAAQPPTGTQQHISSDQSGDYAFHTWKMEQTEKVRQNYREMEANELHFKNKMQSGLHASKTKLTGFTTMAT